MSGQGTRLPWPTITRLGGARMKVTNIREKIIPYLFLSPFLVFFLVFFIYPALNSFYISLTSYKGYGQAKWVGWKNYHAILHYDVFWTGIRNVLTYWVLHAGVMMIISFTMAFIVSSPKYQKLSRLKVILFLPRVIAPTVAALIFRAVFSSNGLFNTVFGVTIPWFQNDTLTKIVVAIILVWRDFGYWFVVFVAGMTSVNPEIIDASIVDGATTMQRIFRIIIPLMKNILKFALIIDGISSLRLFSIPNIIVGQPGALSPTSIGPVMNLLVQNIQQGSFGRASAVGWLLFIMISILTVIQMTAVRDTEDL